MNQPEEAPDAIAAPPSPPAVPAAAIATVALYALGVAGAAIALLAGLPVLTVTAGWEAGTFSAATTAVACALVLGLAIARRFGPAKLRAGTLLALATAATGLAALVAAIVLPAGRFIHRALWPILGGTAPGGWLLDLSLAAFLLLLPTLCFAAMPEAFCRLLGADRLEGRGYAYAATFAGLALGSAVGGVVLLPILGVRGSLLIGVALLGAAAGGLVLTRGSGIEEDGSLGACLAGAGFAATSSPQAGRSASPDRGERGTLFALMAPALTGLAVWGSIVCWSRVVGLIAGPTGPTDATVMAVFLFGLGLGAFGMTALRVRRPAVVLGAALAGGGGIVAATSFFVTRAAVLYLDLVASASTGGLFSFAGALIAILLVLPAACTFGAALVLLPAAVAGERSGRAPFGGAPMIGAIVVGAVAGDLLFRLALVPEFGLRRSASAAAAAAVLAAIVALRTAGETTPTARATGTLTLAGLLLVVAAFPARWDPQIVVSASYRYGARGVERLGSVQEYLAARHTTTPVYYREGKNATVMAERRVQAGTSGQPIEALQLTVDGRVVAGNVADLRTQILQAHLPLLLHGEVHSVLLAGYSTGVTAGSLLTHPIESLLVVEEEPALFGVEPLFGPYSNRPYDDARLSRAVASPRAWLRSDRDRYDAILLMAPAPWLPSDAALLTLEGYEEMKARLNPGGVVAQRIALSTVNAVGAGSILRTFAAAFDDVVLFQISPEDLLLVGASVPLRLDDARMRSDIAGHEAVVGDLSRALSVGVNELLMAVRLEGDALRDLVGGGPINRDDHSTAMLEALRDMRIHDNAILLGAINDAGRDAILKVLVDYGEGTEAAFLYSLAKSYLGLAADPERAKVLAGRLDALGETARATWVRGEASLQEADYDAAMRSWEEVLEAEPDNLDALFSLGIYHLDRRDYFAAERYLAPAARLHPDASIVLYHYGRNLFYLERYAEAIETLDRVRSAASESERYPLIDYLVGVSSLHLKRGEEAVRSLKTYLDWAYAQKNLTALEVEVHNRLAEAYELQGEPMKARDEREKGLQLRIELREFAQKQGGATGGSGLSLPNPGASGPAGEPPADAPAAPSDPVDRPNEP